MKIAVVILNYNGRDLLRQFLPGVIQHSAGATIFVADNASTDDSLEVLKNEFPRVHQLAFPENLGFCGGYNEALRQIAAEYYVLLNSDVEVTPGWLDPVLQQLETNPAIAAAQPKILSYSQRTHFEYAGAAGGYIDWLGYPFCRGRVFHITERDSGQYDNAQPVFWATGACLFIRAKCFHDMGGFDVDFFAHMEEIDLCWRLRRSGYLIYVIPVSTVFHVGGGTLAAQNPRKTYFNFRNSLSLLLKNEAFASLLVVLPLRAVLDAVALLRFLLTGAGQHALAVMRAYLSFLGNLPREFRKRQQLDTLSFLRNDPLVLPKTLVFEFFVRGRRVYAQLVNR
jgi:GT2 family glycosyltransferase